MSEDDSRVSPSRDGTVAAYERAIERLEAALLHIINRVSTEGRDDEHKHLFLVGSEAVKHARAEIADLSVSPDGTVAVEDVLIAARTALHDLCRERGSTDGYVRVFERINAALAEVSPASTGDREENDEGRH